MSRAVAIAVGVALLIFIGGGLFYGCRHDSYYHWRMLLYHGHETKDGAAQEEHAKALVAAGPAGIPLVIEHLELGRYDGRYHPHPMEILRRFGAPAKTQLEKRITELDALAATSPDEINKRRRLREALMASFHDDSPFDAWIADVERLEGEPQRSETFDDIYKTCEWLARNTDTKCPYDVIKDACKLSPEGREWLKEVKARLRERWADTTN